jgi:hypothetical protein
VPVSPGTALNALLNVELNAMTLDTGMLVCNRTQSSVAVSLLALKKGSRGKATLMTYVK